MSQASAAEDDVSAVPDDASRWARLAALGQRIVDGLDEAELEQAVTEAARELLDIEVAAYARVSLDPPSFQIRAVATLPGWELPGGLIGSEISLDLMALGDPLIGKEPFIVIDAATAPASWAAIMQRFGVSVAASVIVGRVDRPSGLLGVGAGRVRTFDNQDIAIVRALASLLAGALGRSAGERALALRIRQQEALADLGSHVIAGMELTELAGEVVRVLGQTQGPDIAGVARTSEGGRRYELIAGLGLDPASIDPSLLTTSAIGAAVVASEEPIILSDLRDRSLGQTPGVLDRLGMTSLVLARIGEPDSLWGLLGMADHLPGRFGQDDAAFLRSLANLLASAVALERATAAIADHARHIEEARFEERTALAREIHDGLVQDLWLARLHHGLVAEALAQAGEVEPRLAELGAAIDRAGESARQAVMTLRAGEGGGTSLAADLATYVADAGRRLGIPVDVRTSTSLPDLPARTQAELLRIVREVLTNAARHAGPTRVELEIATDRRGLRIAIRDDGRGFDPEQVAPGSAGLSGMRERAGLIGATIGIRSRPGRGTTITIALPRRAWTAR